MPTKLFIARTTNGASEFAPSTGRFATLLASGTWGGALLTVEISPDEGVTWIATEVQLSANGVKNFIAGKGTRYRVVLSGSTAPTNLNVWLAFES